jgi:hypothetical protein
MAIPRPLLLAFRLCCLGAFLARPVHAQDADNAPSFDFLYGDRELFPSAIVCFTEDSPYAPNDKEQIGDPQGVISVSIKAPTDDCPVRITFSETPFFEESHIACRLPKAGVVYRVAPLVRYRAEKLAAQKQPLANLIIRAEIEMQGATTEISEKIVVHSVNDAIMQYRPRAGPDGEQDWKADAKFLLAAYVNENNPWIDQRVTRHALDKGYVDAFEGYQRDGTFVKKEVRAVYDTLRDFGFKYTSFKEYSAAPAHKGGNVRLEGIRLVGDTLESAQANGAETVLILASIFRKLSIDNVIFFLPRKQVLLGVYTELGRKKADSLIVLDPRKLGYEDFDASVAAGTAAFNAAKDSLIFGEGDDQAKLRLRAEHFGYLAVDIAQARQNGILPIPEVRRDFHNSFREITPERAQSP